MIEVKDKIKCIGCQACFSTCPRKCISMSADSEGFLYPQIDLCLCIDCGLCERACPVINKQDNTNLPLPTAYAAINKDDIIRLKSSSGGIFTLIAEEVIRNSGTVFGAAMSEDFKSVMHIEANNIDTLDKLRGSKYVQSSIGDTYNTTEKYLQDGKPVLFTGTPCQIAGLKAYLKTEYINLVTQDFICHGVPSPLVWRKYIELCEAKAKSKAYRVLFRHKKHGWKNYSVLIEFSDKTVYERIYHKDYFMQGFLSNLYLRPSCYGCIYKGVHRQSDITLADYWGIENVEPNIDDNKGVSFVMLHTAKAIELFDKILPYIEYNETDIIKAISYNSSAINSSIESKKRKYFFSKLNKMPLDKLIHRCTRKQPLQRVLYRLHSMIFK